MRISSKHIFGDETGAATIIEYVIVFPIVMAIVCVLIFTGYLVFERAALESAAERTALYVAKTVQDQNYASLTQRSEGSTEIDSISFDGVELQTQPYRYLFSGTQDMQTQAEEIARGYISEAQIFGMRDVSVSAKVASGVFQKVTVGITEDFGMPSFLGLVELPSAVTINSKSVIYINDPDEFIRNADFAADLVEDVMDTTGVSDKVSGVVDKVNTVVSKISFFKSETGQ